MRSIVSQWFDLRQHGLFIWEKLLVGRNVLPSKQPCLLSDFVELQQIFFQKIVKPCGILFFVFRQITQLIAVMQIQPIQSADLFDFVFSCGQAVLSDSYRFFCKGNDKQLLIFHKPTLDCVLGIIFSEWFQSYRLLISFRNNRPILSAIAETMLISHLREDIIKGL